MREIKATRVFYENLNSPLNFNLNVGGARSSKSYSILQLLVTKFINEKNKKFLIVRKTLPSLKITSYRVFVDLLKQYGYYGMCQHNKSDLTLEMNGNIVDFKSIDDVEKIKSTDYNYIFVEEITELDYDDYRVLTTRLSAPTHDSNRNMFYMAMNPVVSWVNEVLLADPTIHQIHSTYKDNPFLQPEYIKILENLEAQDPTYWKIYGMGEFATISNLIYPPYQMVPLSSYPLSDYDEAIYGIDFGFNNPTVVLEYLLKDMVPFGTEKLYETRLTNGQLIDKMKQGMIKKCHVIYADCAEPNRIQEICDAGFNCLPADKSVKDGIDFVKRLYIRSCQENVHMNQERKFYKYKMNKAGQVLDEPVKFNDHAPDAERYALYTHLKTFVGMTPADIKSDSIPKESLEQNALVSASEEIRFEDGLV